MPNWSYKLDLKDVFHSEVLSFEEIRDETVRRIESSPFWDEGDSDLTSAVVGLRWSEDAGTFNERWDDFYDWADSARVWVETW